jgi:hypothetical protein
VITPSASHARACLSNKEFARSWSAVFVLGLALVVVAGLVIYPKIGPDMFFSWDSATYVTNARDYFENGTLTGLVASYTQSLGNLAYPFNYNLLPEVRLAYFGGAIHPVLMYLVASILYFSSAFVLAAIIGFGPLTAMVSGLTMIWLTMPLTSPPLFSIIFWYFSPYSIPHVYQFTLLFVTTYYIGRLGIVGNLLAILLLILEVIWVNVAGAKGGIFVVLGAGLFGIAIATSSESRKVFAWRGLAAVLVLLVIVTTGVLHYIRGIYAYTATLLLFSEMQSSGTLGALLRTMFPDLQLSYLQNISKIWLNDQLGYPLTILSTVGVIWTIIWPPTRIARHLAIAMIALLPFLLLFIYGQVIGSAAYPLYVIYAVAGAFAVGRWAWSGLAPYLVHHQDGTLRVAGLQLAKLSPNGWSPAATIALVMLSFTMVARVADKAPAGWIYPPSRPPLIETLASSIRFAPGDTFHGRYLDMSITAPLEDGTLPKGSTLVYGLMKVALDHVMAFGNDLTVQGPRFYDVPVALELNRLNSAASVLFYNFLLSTEGEVQRIDTRTVTHFDPRLFRLLGIKYVLSQRPIDREYASRVEVSQLPAETSLYEVSGINVGQFSPLQISVIPEWRSVLERMAAADFDPEQSAILQDNWAGTASLSRATAQIVRTVGGYRVTANSSGRALIVLPFEFSRCLVVNESEGSARIGRADFFLTGLVFENKVDAELRFRFGPFENAGCRLADLADIRAMGLDIASFEDFRKRHPGRFQFEGVF